MCTIIAANSSNGFGSAGMVLGEGAGRSQTRREIGAWRLSFGFLVLLAPGSSRLWAVSGRGVEVGYFTLDHAFN
jgi:hypothetical protein